MSEHRFVPFLLLLLMIAPTSRAQVHGDRRPAELQQLREMLPPSVPFEQWLASSGQLPPDFLDLPKQPYPQDPLTVYRDGKLHRLTPEEWPARRAEMRKLLEDWLLGHAPPQKQDVRATIDEKMHEADRDIWAVRLTFGPDHAATLHCWLFMSPNMKKPAPVFLVDNFKYTRFAEDALLKGTFAVCVYNAGDPAYFEYMPPYVKARQDDSDTFKDLFGNYDWSEFHRRGWAASRAVDWLSTLDFVDAKHIYIGGHSRSAKQSTACAAFDDRIAGVIASSPGSGGSLCFRYCDQYYYGESAELLTRNFPRWVSPKVRFFTGRENLLPCDTHFEYALIAPRPVLMSTAINDAVENTWSVERSYDLVHPVYEFLGAGGNLAARYRPGPHAPDADTYHAHSDFLETVAAGKLPADLFPRRPIHVWDYQKWLAENKPDRDPKDLPDLSKSSPVRDPSGKMISKEQWPQKRAAIRADIAWLLGNGPAYEHEAPNFWKGETDDDAKRLHRPGHDHTRLRFGDDINGDFYRPSADKDNGVKFPAVIWLAPLHTATGYVPAYNEGAVPYTRWVKEADCIVLAFDPIATGNRQEERREFCDRYPHWSLMGKMVYDARHAIDAALAAPDVDPKHVYLIGFGMGGMVATLTGALDDRVTGVVSIAGFTPFRDDTDSSSTGGLRRYSELYGWLPRLGAFVGQEQKVPVDFDEILASIAPRSTLIIAPKLDWHTTPASITHAADAAREAYALLGSDGAITVKMPETPCQFDNPSQMNVVDWLKRNIHPR